MDAILPKVAFIFEKWGTHFNTHALGFSRTGNHAAIII